MIKSKFEPLPIREVKALLLAHEARMKKFQKRFADSPSINVAQGYNSSSNNFSSQNWSNYSENCDDFNSGSGYSRRGSDSDRGGGYRYEGNGFGVLEVIVVATEVVVVMQIFSGKFASNLVTQQWCVIFAMILIFSQTCLSRWWNQCFKAIHQTPSVHYRIRELILTKTHNPT